ncbi:MAG: endolytic transglycosylase MltG [Patescibacteria group bacterium]
MENFPPLEINTESLPRPSFIRKNRNIFYISGAGILLLIIYFFLLRAPSDFPVGAIINIEEGKGLHSVSRDLESENIIKSRVAFEFFVMLYGGEKHIIPADYLFEHPTPVFEVARRISRGERHLAPVAVTIPEGFNILEEADAFTAKLPNFNKANFLTAAEEGYMFPDTYFFFTTDTEADALRLMKANFEKKVAPLRPEIAAAGKSEKQIIIMASVIEKEAKGNADRALISGILWRRLAIGMPLQVDAALETYKSRGLPKDPICNPGLDAIVAAIHPEKSGYLYYLHDKDGVVHFAKSFAEHQANIKKFLK